MTKLILSYPVGATPLDPNERDGLKVDYITTQAELNELEQKNIQQAVLWLRKQRVVEPLNPSFAFELHRQMFGQVRKWAGRTRTSDKNIGIDWHQISTQIPQLFEDTKFWIEHQSFTIDEIAVRFHHRLVQIHAFPNGNGRHARLLTDLLLEVHGHEAFSWGKTSTATPMETEGPRRMEYLAALKDADKNDYAGLLVFVRS